MDISKILLTLSYIKHKQFDCSLQVNKKSIKMIQIVCFIYWTWSEGIAFGYNLL